MVHKDIHPVPEIDNELMLFRELVNVRNKRSNPLVISQGGRIAQHLVEFSVMRGNNNYYSYGSTFEEFLRELDYIPNDIKEIIIIIYNFRRDVVLSPNNIKFNENEMLYFYKTFMGILNWFRYYYQETITEEDFFFKEMDKTINDLNKKIYKLTDDNPEEKTTYNNSTPTMEDIEEYLRYLLPEFADYFIHKVREVMQEQDQKWDKRYNVVRQDQKAVLQNQKNMDDKLNQIIDDLKELKNVIKGYKEEVYSKLKTALEEEKDSIISEFTDKCVEKIQEYTENYIGTEFYKKEEADLMDDFGESWSKLSDESKTFLITSKFTYGRIKSSKDLSDYSGVCLLVTKALELELYNRFFKDFIKYSRKEYRKNYIQYHTSLVQQNKDNDDYFVSDKSRFCDLGTITCILGFNRWGELKDDGIYDNNTFKLIDYSSEHIFKQLKLSDNEIKDKLYKYGCYVNKVREDYRNPAAHTNELKKDDADECFDFVLDSCHVLITMLESFDY